MKAQDRHSRILAALAREGRVSVTELARDHDVTVETIRRDLAVLDRAGALRKIHGGALPVAQTDREPSILQRLGVGTGEKQRIAERALAELPGQGTILLDSGTTTLALARLLAKDLGLDGEYPTILLRIGYGKPQPYSKRRSIEEVMM